MVSTISSSVGRRILLSYALVLALMMVPGLVLIFDLDSLRSFTADLYQHPFATTNAALEARFDATLLRNRMLQVAISEDVKQVAPLAGEVDHVAKRLAEEMSTVRQTFLGDLTRVDDATRALSKWNELRQSVIALAATGRRDEAAHLANAEGSQIFSTIDGDLDYVIAFAKEKAGFFKGMAEQRAAISVEVAWALLAAMAIICGSVGFWTARTVVSALIRNAEERQRVFDELSLAGSIFENTIEGLTVTDAMGTILTVNPAFTHITGYTAEEAIGQNPRILKSDRQDQDFYDEMWRKLAATGQWQGEIWNRRKSGEAILEWLSIRAIADRNGNITRYVAAFSDITELRRMDDRIRHQAYHDALTGLPNRFLLQDRLRQEIVKAERDGSHIAVMLFDLDRFKVVNDTLGHSPGDALLKTMSARLLSCLRRSDSAARLGGDEFIAVVPGLNGPREAASIAENILSQIAEPLNLGGQDLQMSASIGIAVFPEDGKDSDTLMKNADSAMYQAKANGRNTYQFFDGNMNVRAAERLDLETRLRRAVANGEFELHYQPKICLNSGRPGGTEALLRWRGPDGRLISPADFIPIAEETGLIVPIGEWVIEEACRQSRAWAEAGIDCGSIAVNISARQLHNSALPQRIEASMRAHALPAGSIEIELTESAVMQDAAVAITILEKLRALRLGIWIDDFGTGYSSLAYLKRLPITGLKIDRSFVAEIETDTDDAAIVSTIISLADTLRLGVVAEGVETPGQIAFLNERKCNMAQGYYFSRPLAASDCASWFETAELRAAS